MKPTLSIVTVASFDLERLKKTVESMDYSVEGFEHIFVLPEVDSEGAALVDTVCKSHSNTFLVKDNGQGIYSAMNLGAFCARGEYLVFWNAGELLVSSDSLSRLIKRLNETTPIVCLAGWQDVNGDNFPESNLVRSFLRNDNVGFISHQAFLLSRQVFKVMRGFDTRYSVAADTKMIRQVLNKYDVAFFQESVVWVEPQLFSSKNHRRGRFEFFLIILSRPLQEFGLTAAYNFLRKELKFLINRISRRYLNHFR